ncbi:MAG: hypothetical protein HND44_15920 [Chloroflexi bacterium]|nr:hypothetical protein [Ardenticatenaceae bacterium]NOG36035.1 hypothetical protein [Chloroflexota bacterium]GIK56484.1 MAG: hypothetical protein BroJett015_21470 [Chloroflexota bacterium]
MRHWALIERVRANLYRAELAVWLNNLELARASLQAATLLELTEDEKAALSDEIAHVTRLLAGG